MGDDGLSVRYHAGILSGDLRNPDGNERSYGDNRLCLRLGTHRSVYADGKTSYVYDGRGSVVQAVTAPVAGEKVSSALPDVAVKVQSFLYTAFGEQMGAQKVSGFAYNAEAYDAATGMINLRARQYEPTIGRFEQKDPGKKSSNEMLYCDNSPIRFADFDGYEIVVISGNVFKTPPTEGEREIKYGVITSYRLRLGKYVMI